MKNIVKQIFLVIVFVMHFYCLSYAQQKVGGEYDVTLKKSYCAEYKDTINWLYVGEPDSIPDVPDRGETETVGFGIPINRAFFQLATKQESVSDEYIFLLRITQEEAINTFLFFDEYYLPEGPEITFLDTNGVLLDQNRYPPYDYYYNLQESEEGRVTWNIPPDAIVKFTCKKDELQECILHLKYIHYGYKDLTINLKPAPLCKDLIT